ncbi:ABC transporter substrate-binding protein [Acidimicrobiia bacterium EGI L10123]|uniref:ABC transporter substrate-binding protein n=1 Tax=Salinilacustrithrix flava TaxID=2957203 RepID=UPI003D7C1B05|nr:ABC transporter substrate-binding protein [Acidimicrobiia bacterium EGI L10123]
MNRRILALTASTMLVLAACGSRTDTDAAATAPSNTTAATEDGQPEDTVDNGGATDVGVTGDEIVIGVVADLTGVVPGLFKSAPDAVKAHAAMINEAGGIHGRMIRVEVFDTGTSDNGNRLAYEEACEADIFALVGSFSAFDTGGYDAQVNCDTPTIPANVTDPEVDLLPNVYPRTSEDFGNSGPARWFAEEFPDAVTAGSFIFIDAPVTERGARNSMEMRRSVGWDFVYEQPVTPLESNYTPHVLEMDRRGAQAFATSLDQSNIVRLVKALREQNYELTIKEVGTQGYSADFLEAAGPAAEGSYIPLTHALLEETDRVPAMQDYTDWLDETGGDEASSNGLLSWTRAMLFAEAVEAVGPDLTREALVQELESMTAWDADGLLPPQDVGEARPEQSCFIMVQIQDGQFARIHPDEGFDCSPDYVYEYEA